MKWMLDMKGFCPGVESEPPSGDTQSG